MQIAQNVDIIFISVKPQYVGVVIKEMKPHLTGKHIMVSIAAGIPLSVMKVCYHPNLTRFSFSQASISSRLY